MPQKELIPRPEIATTYTKSMTAQMAGVAGAGDSGATALVAALMPAIVAPPTVAPPTVAPLRPQMAAQAALLLLLIQVQHLSSTGRTNSRNLSKNYIVCI